eukprot:CAMPEP_0179455856 /NCGR_PEP_ID=MMETSP0799-20121207/39704_1 /TAXON_ID=46947 /ORGANISM="Geminigera cryophila, Strain CCMP2564" /LENGTH=57 /DNA_ID=CAMNT_0021255121 /DNA_START=110 /DNA_END=283 /DNA_ORIENTATION=+
MSTPCLRRACLSLTQYPRMYHKTPQATTCLSARKQQDVSVLKQQHVSVLRQDTVSRR